MNKIYRLCLTLVAITGFTANTAAQSAGSLPGILIVDFNANLITGNKVNIEWTTQQQLNTDFYDVQKSIDGFIWNSIAFVKATGISSIPVSYQITDLFPFKGSNFYRIRLRGLSGLAGYTMTKIVRMNMAGNITIYPNPSAKLVNICMHEPPGTDWNIALINHTGAVIVQKRFSKKSTTVSLPVGNYPNGNYILEINDGNSHQNKALMINHN